MKLMPIQPKKAYMEIIDQFKTLIKEGVFKPGEKLPSERELVEQLNVSRPTLREALSALEIIGLVESKPGEGRFVMDIPKFTISDQLIKRFLDDSEPFELLEARITIETGTASIAAKKAENDEIIALEQELKKMEEFLRRGGASIEERLAVDAKFHFIIAEMSRNKFLIKVMEQISYLLKDEFWSNQRRHLNLNKKAQERYLLEHRNIFRAIKDGDPEKAGKYMQEHLFTVWRDLLTK